MLHRILFCAAAIVLTLSACSNVEKIKKSTDQNFKLAKADEFFNNKKWEEANVLYEELVPLLKGTKGYEDMYYRYAYSFYNQDNFLAASYHFKNFADIFANSPKHDECEYMYCMCLYKMSPEPSMDQGSTVKAIAALQTYVNSHPESAQIAEANKIIDEGRAKIETKERNSAELYFKISEFKAARVAFENLIKKFPDSDRCDYYQLMVMRSNYQYAKNSIPEKQAERYNTALVDFNDLISNYPKTTLKGEAEQLKNTIFADLKKIEKQ